LRVARQHLDVLLRLIREGANTMKRLIPASIIAVSLMMAAACTTTVVARPPRPGLVLVEGRWVAPPRAGAIWIAPHWERRAFRRVWVAGYWRY
jgi:hypothetical protein